MKPLLSAFLLLALAAPGAQAQDAPAGTAIGFGTYLALQALDQPNFGGDYSTDETITDTPSPARALETRPVTRPFVDYAPGKRLVHISGVLLDGPNGQPVPGARVNVIAEVEGGFVAFHQVRTDTRGVYNDWFQAASPITSVSVDAPSVWLSDTPAGVTSGNNAIDSGTL